MLSPNARKGSTRRAVLQGTGAIALSLTLRYAAGAAAAGTPLPAPYGRWEDLMRRKWTWDRVVRGTHGTNCTGNCAFNVYVKNGIVWREEQQGEYGKSTPDVPDYGPRGCQKGLRHAKYMYGPQRVLYPMKRIGERGQGRWQRIGWDQAMNEIADRFIDNVVAHGPRSISFDLGTQMVLKRASFAGLGRLAVITGIELPEAFAGVGDLPTGVQMTVGEPLLGDTMAAIFKSKCVLVWFCNPAVTRIPDAHFFWEARYNGTEVIAISPEFTPSAMHASKWLNPKPGTDTALALAMAQVIVSAGRHDVEYLREQTDMPFLVRTDNHEFLRETDFSADKTARSNLFYIWDEATGKAVPAPATGNPPPPPGSPAAVIPGGSLRLDGLRPALEGHWRVTTPSGTVAVTTVFELLKRRLQNYTPEKASRITGIHPAVIREVAAKFATAKPAMIFTGYRACKWLHGDLLQRSFMLLLSLTGNLGKEGGGYQLENLGRIDSQLAYMFDGLPPTLRVATMSRWDYVRNDGRSLNEHIYGRKVADKIDHYFQESLRGHGWPDYGEVPWKMGFFAGSNTASWRASGTRWRQQAFEKLETIVAMTPDMGVTAMYADYVLPIAHHYERQDYMLEARTPYVQALDAAVPPLGEAVDDWHAIERLAGAISARAAARKIAPVQDNFMGVMPVARDLTRCHDLYTMGGRVTATKQAIQYLMDRDEGVPRVPFDELAARGLMRNGGTERTVYGPDSPYGSLLLRAVERKEPYPTLTGRQQYYLDHEWFLAEDEALPRHKDPLRIKGYPLQFLMGHVRHGIHSMWTDDPLLLSLRRGEPDIYVNPDDARSRGVKDGDLLTIFNNLGEFIAMAHVSSAIQPGMVFMYHGWDPMLFRGRQNFGSVIPTAGLIKPTSLVSGYGHVTYRPLAFEPNHTFHDFTCDFRRHTEAAAGKAAGGGVRRRGRRSRPASAESRT